MGLRIRKSFKVAPGVRINVGKKSSSISFGTKGARHTISSTGRRTTSVGIPGTGVTYTSTSSSRKKKSSSADMSSDSFEHFYEFINLDYKNFLSEKEFRYYAFCTDKGFLFDVDDRAILTQSGKRNSILTYKICYVISLVLSIILLLFSIVGFAVSVPVGIVFLIFAAIMYFPFRGYRKMISIHRKIFDAKNSASHE